MTTSGLTRQAPAAADATLTLEDDAPSKMWNTLAVDALDGQFASLAEQLARAESNALSAFVAQLPWPGYGRSMIHDIRSTIRLFNLADTVTPTIGVRFTAAFREQSYVRPSYPRRKTMSFVQ